MPHVASQILHRRPPVEIRSREFESAMSGTEFLRPATIAPSQRRPMDAEIPSPCLLVTSPDDPDGSSGFIGHRGKTSQKDTPVSAVDSVFELPSAQSYQKTPDSSTHSLCITELEDTSPRLFSNSHDRLNIPQQSPCLSKGSTCSLPHLPTNLGTSFDKPKLMRIKPPQIPMRRILSSKFRSRPHPGSPAATGSLHLHIDQPKNLSSIRISKPQSHLRSGSGASVSNSDVYDPPPPPIPRNPCCLREAPANAKSPGLMAIEAITAIEEDNYKLSSRALAAEMRVKTLEELNIILQQRVIHCDEHHRPKTAPSQNWLTTSDAISTFNATPIPRHPAPLQLTPKMISMSHDYDLAASGSPTRPVRRGQLQAQASSHATHISRPIPGSVSRQQVTHMGPPISQGPPVAKIHLEELGRREISLPYTMPMAAVSPSEVPGFVEMGSRAEVCADEKVALKKKKTFGKLLWWSKRQGGRV